MNWKKLKAISFESDDWGGPDRIGWTNMQTYQEAMKNPDLAIVCDKSNVWQNAMNTMERVEDMDMLFELLNSFKGGNGKPAVFTPICFLANPDFDAIRKNNFTEYVDIGIDKEYPESWRHCGDVIAKAREGIEMGVWVPESHNTRTAGHFDPYKWLKFLRDKKDPALNAFFEFNMIGKPVDKFLNVGREFDALNLEELKEWIKTGTQYFHNAFGYSPRVSGLADARNCCKILEEILEKILVQNGVTTITNAVNKEQGEYNPDLDLVYTKRNVNFEPALAREEGTPYWETCYQDILNAWDNNEPAIVNTHRVNYTSLDSKLKEDSFRQLEALLTKIQEEHPEVTYLSSHEIGDLYREKA